MSLRIMSVNVYTKCYKIPYDRMVVAFIALFSKIAMPRTIGWWDN